jgi:hypothetical protein
LERYDAAFERRKAAANQLVEARHNDDPGLRRQGLEEYRMLGVFVPAFFFSRVRAGGAELDGALLRHADCPAK